MKVDRISYQKAFAYGPYLQEKIGAEAIIEPGEDRDKAMQQLQEWINSRATSPDYENHEDIPGEITVDKEQPVDKRLSVIIQDIGTCGDLKVLETYKFIVKTNEELQKAYDKKKAELQKIKK